MVRTARKLQSAAAGRSGVCGGSVPVFGGVLLDLCGLNGIRDVDTTSMLLDVRAGTFGDRLEDTLRAEHQVTIGGESYAVPQPFLVLATQNPIEAEGTYQLPEAQVDRFLFKLGRRLPRDRGRGRRRARSRVAKRGQARPVDAGADRPPRPRA